MINQQDLIRFVHESNLIEGIVRDPSPAEIIATQEFIEKSSITIPDLVALVQVYAPGHVIRDQPNLNVRIGAYVPPAGGKQIVTELEKLLDDVNGRRLTPWQAHVNFEFIHGFTDGNGRSGRTLWAWHMIASGQDPFSLSFLHRFYYQTLSHQDKILS